MARMTEVTFNILLVSGVARALQLTSLLAHYIPAEQRHMSYSFSRINDGSCPQMVVTLQKLSRAHMSTGFVVINSHRRDWLSGLLVSIKLRHAWLVHRRIVRMNVGLMNYARGSRRRSRMRSARGSSSASRSHLPPTTIPPPTALE